MRSVKFLGYGLVGLIVVGFLGIVGIQREPKVPIIYFTAEILDRRYKGVSVVTGAPTEGEIRVTLPDKRIIWVPALRYYLDKHAVSACLVQKKGRLTGIETFAAAKRQDCE